MRNSWPILISSVFVALVLSILPLPDAFAIGRPACVAAVAAYWILRMPARFGLFSAGLCGLCLDVITPSLLGQHALALGLVAYLSFKMRDMLHMFPSWQQAIALLPVWAVYELCLFAVDSWAGHSIDAMWRWMPVLTTTLFWLPMTLLIEGVGPRRRTA